MRANWGRSHAMKRRALITGISCARCGVFPAFGKTTGNSALSHSANRCRQVATGGRNWCGALLESREILTVKFVWI